MRMTRSHEWKLVLYFDHAGRPLNDGKRHELFQLTADPDGLVNPYGKSASLGILSRRSCAVVNRYVITMTLLALARVNFPACGEDALQEEWPVKPIGLQVADPVLTKVRRFTGGRWCAGTTILLQCSPPEGFVIAWDEQRSSVSSYVDERGNNLAGEYRDGKLEGSSLRFLGCSEDRRHSGPAGGISVVPTLETDECSSAPRP